MFMLLLDERQKYEHETRDEARKYSTPKNKIEWTFSFQGSASNSGRKVIYHLRVLYPRQEVKCRVTSVWVTGVGKILQ